MRILKKLALLTLISKRDEYAGTICPRMEPECTGYRS